MTPTLAPGSIFVYDRDYYRTNDVVPGDIVVVRHNGEILVKRIYAAAGHRFWACRDTVDERLVHYPIRIENLDRYRQMVDDWQKMGRTDTRVVRMQVPRDSAFLMGDALDSVDSREFGFVPVDNILGRVFEAQRVQLHAAVAGTPPS
jgi:signal peptidase I